MYSLILHSSFTLLNIFESHEIERQYVQCLILPTHNTNKDSVIPPLTQSAWLPVMAEHFFLIIFLYQYIGVSFSAYLNILGDVSPPLHFIITALKQTL